MNLDNLRVRKVIDDLKDPTLRMHVENAVKEYLNGHAISEWHKCKRSLQELGLKYINRKYELMRSVRGALSEDFDNTPEGTGIWALEGTLNSVRKNRIDKVSTF